MSLQLTYDSRELQRAIRHSPAILAKHIDRAVDRIAQEMAVLARIGAPKAHSILTNSITVRRPDKLTGEVVTGSAYARLVEQGTGPGGWPPQQTMLDWIRVHGIQPNDPEMDQQDLAYVMSRSIARKGTPAQPFMAPAFEQKKARAGQLLDQAVDKALQEMAR